MHQSVKDIASKKYDFVIVGGGTAGLTVAARLTEDPSISVLVLEAGSNRMDDPKINIPAMMIQLYEDPTYDWCFKSTPQIHANNRIIAQPRGKLLGGTSNIHFMMHSHPSVTDIDNWEKLGNPGWNFETLKPYYKKYETYNEPTEELGKTLGSEIIDPSLHGRWGPVQSTFPHGTSEVDAMWRPTLQTLGFGAEKDPRDGSTLGAATAYYAPNTERENLAVLTEAHVNKILLDGTPESAIATGVSFSVLGEDYAVLASREVILSAGTFLSPKILELSGIRSREILEKHSIETIVENDNVGENLQDHMLVPLQYKTVDGIATAETIKQPGVLDWALGEWQAGRGGPLASGVSGTSFLSYASIVPYTVPSTLKPAQHTLPTKQFELQKAQFENDAEAALQFNFARTGFNPYNSESVASLFQHDDPGNYIGAGTASTHPFSRGSVHISSPCPSDAPTIDPNYLSNPLDIEILARGLLFAQKIFETKPLADVVKDSADGGGKKIQPSFNIEERLDLERAREFVREAGISSWHPIGTCSMLPREEGGVVDDRLKVYGVKGLRVVDASIMPLHIRGNICSGVYAIAERAADLIKEDWRGSV